MGSSQRILWISLAINLQYLWKLTLDNSYSNYKIDPIILKDSLIVNSANLDSKYNIKNNGWQNLGLGQNPDGSKANVGVYGGPNSW